MSISSLPLWFTNSASQASLPIAMFLDPVAQLSDEFDLEINDLLVAKINGLHNEHDREMVHNHVRTQARQLLLKLQNLRGMGATSQQLRQTGLETLRELETTSVNMVQEFERFQTGTRDLEQRFAAFDARVMAPAKTQSWAAFSETSNQSSFETAFQGFLHDKATERVATARVTAATLNAMGSVVAETAAVVFGCRSSEEGANNCRAVLGYVKTGAKKAEEVVKDVVTRMGAKPALKRMMSGNAMTQRLAELGIDPASAQQYDEDCNTISLQLAFAGGMTGSAKIFRTVFHPMSKQAPKEFNWHQNRMITKRTKIVPEDLGISSAEFFNDRRPFYSNGVLDGWMTLKKDVLKVQVERLMVPEGRFFNLMSVFVNLKKIAKTNGATTVQIEAQIVNKKLLNVMAKKFGEPKIEFTFHIFKIPVK
jgi:hypothetical protein